MLKRFRLWLGPQRLQSLFLLLAITGIGSLILNIAAEDGAEWVTAAQNVLVLTFVIGTAFIIGGRMEPYERGRWVGILAPAFGAILLGVVFFPDQLLLLSGAALGWIVAGVFLFRPRGPMAYQKAIKAFRKNNYEEAVNEITTLIREEPKQANHYRLRAEFFRVWGKLDRAKKDYQKVADLLPGHEKWVGYNGVSEVELQNGRYDIARKAGEKALAVAPDQWVVSYNLGMIEDRDDNPQAALDYLQQSLDAKVPEAHYRFLIHFYRARAHARLGNLDAAKDARKQMRKQAGGLNQWQIILQSDQADTLRSVLEADIATAEQLYNDEITVEALATDKTKITG
jgi:tetratricopeptide (TPR) repeat protein